MDGCPPDPEKRIMELHVNRGRASADELERVLVDSAEEDMHLRTVWIKFRRSVIFVAPLIGRRICRFRGRPPFQRLIENCKRICYSWATWSPCAR